uniref:Helicase ATP-binding domain-containing protein n=1 Tax=viral metagenome TaxID=1070528 RepID=A0A6C0F409_9ZZZZ
MLTLQGYKLDKNSVPNLIQLKTALTVKPYIPSVFVKPQYVQKYPVFVETKDHIFVPKHYGIAEFGLPSKTERDVPKTPAEFWKFEGKIRDNQVEVVNSYLTPEPRDGIISLQTGGGKTVCALYIASKIQMPTIVLVHNTFLRDQWIDRIKAFLPKARIGSLQADVVDIDNKDITVAMLQSVALKEYPKGTFERFGLVIVDECHHIASEAFSRAVPKLTCKHMLGLSATPERKDRLMCVINWFLGPMLYKSDTSDKVDEKVKVEVYEFAGDEKYNEIIYNNSGVMFTTLMINKVVEYEPRNTMVAGLIEDLADEEGRQLLVLTDRVGHTKTLFDLLPDHKKDMACILGRDVPAKTRAEWCASKKILIATYQMCKEGFDVATLNTLVIATPRPDVDQIVGRILRVEKKGRKVDPLIIDIVDESFRRQFQERLSLYKKRNYTVEKMKLL